MTYENHLEKLKVGIYGPRNHDGGNHQAGLALKWSEGIDTIEGPYCGSYGNKNNVTRFNTYIQVDCPYWDPFKMKFPEFETTIREHLETLEDMDIIAYVFGPGEIPCFKQYVDILTEFVVKK